MKLHQLGRVPSLGVPIAQIQFYSHHQLDSISHPTSDTTKPLTWTTKRKVSRSPLMKINDDGDKLAIYSHFYPQNHIGGSSPQHLLRLYDIWRKDGRSPTSKVALGHARTNCAAFSRDGFYLAIGNADRHVIVHDVRMNRTLRDYVHVGSGRGIAHLEWRITRGYRLSLFSGGPDGSIRRWQPEGAMDQGMVVANVGTHITHFAMQNGPSEHDLVIAQSDGTVSFWDGYGEI
ncbi:hypothetical protein F5878DRAFT_664079 [Lentinula raphanica]|uniref:WD40 repeat-like protein n=1 Tax=Lentinula raphanica TaxID=153919 RepID=A0AA38P345_9AGAR|nr:hypothetical protein F5878DRAFT_664079 [Lentinula raphanica]